MVMLPQRARGREELELVRGNWGRLFVSDMFPSAWVCRSLGLLCASHRFGMTGFRRPK